MTMNTLKKKLVLFSLFRSNSQFEKNAAIVQQYVLHLQKEANFDFSLTDSLASSFRQNFIQSYLFWLYLFCILKVFWIIFYQFNMEKKTNLQKKQQQNQKVQEVHSKTEAQRQVKIQLQIQFLNSQNQLQSSMICNVNNQAQNQALIKAQNFQKQKSQNQQQKQQHIQNVSLSGQKKLENDKIDKKMNQKEQPNIQSDSQQSVYNQCGQLDKQNQKSLMANDDIPLKDIQLQMAPGKMHIHQLQQDYIPLVYPQTYVHPPPPQTTSNQGMQHVEYQQNHQNHQESSIFPVVNPNSHEQNANNEIIQSDNEQVQIQKQKLQKEEERSQNKD